MDDNYSNFEKFHSLCSDMRVIDDAIGYIYKEIKFNLNPIDIVIISKNHSKYRYAGVKIINGVATLCTKIFDTIYPPIEIEGQIDDYDMNEEHRSSISLCKSCIGIKSRDLFRVKKDNNKEYLYGEESIFKFIDGHAGVYRHTSINDIRFSKDGDLYYIEPDIFRMKNTKLRIDRDIIPKYILDLVNKQNHYTFTKERNIKVKWNL